MRRPFSKTRRGWERRALRRFVRCFDWYAFTLNPEN